MWKDNIYLKHIIYHNRKLNLVLNNTIQKEKKEDQKNSDNAKAKLCGSGGYSRIYFWKKKPLIVLGFLMFVFKSGERLSFCHFGKMNIENDLLIMSVKTRHNSLHTFLSLMAIKLTKSFQSCFQTFHPHSVDVLAVSEFFAKWHMLNVTF